MNSSHYDHELLATLRQAKGLTQEELARMVGVTRVHIIRVERGRSASYGLLKKITRIYDKPITAVLRVSEPASV